MGYDSDVHTLGGVGVEYSVLYMEISQVVDRGVIVSPPFPTLVISPIFHFATFFSHCSVRVDALLSQLSRNDSSSKFAVSSHASGRETVALEINYN